MIPKPVLIPRDGGMELLGAFLKLVEKQYEKKEECDCECAGCNGVWHCHDKTKGCGM